jgi:RNA polymerase sigma-70 factor (ECF subfamily)
MRSEAELRLEKLLELAVQGNHDALGQMLDHFRPELKDLARRRIAGSLQTRVDESDLVQQSCLSAIRNFPRFEGRELADFVAWLRQIHERNITDTIRSHTLVEKRAISRQEPTDDALQATLARTVSPSQQVLRSERAAEVAAALDELPDSHREAVQMRYFEGCSLSEIAQRTNRTEDAVAGLLRRAMVKLRSKLRE